LSRVGASRLEEAGGRVPDDEVIRAYYARAASLYSAGANAGQLWRFLRAMAPGDLVLVPHGATIHVGRIAGDVAYYPDPSAEHWAFSRPVEWLTGQAGVPRDSRPPSLRAAM